MKTLTGFMVQNLSKQTPQQQYPAPNPGPSGPSTTSYVLHPSYVLPMSFLHRHFLCIPANPTSQEIHRFPLDRHFIQMSYVKPLHPMSLGPHPQRNNNPVMFPLHKPLLVHVPAEPSTSHFPQNMPAAPARETKVTEKNRKEALTWTTPPSSGNIALSTVREKHVTKEMKRLDM
uniref:Uncharacterized protein n=1 Tax=Sphaerodactylus townsendi TaxID=933632 RepID=A0ACB8GDK6_9SAUR